MSSQSLGTENIFLNLFPSPNENDFTTSLYCVMNPKRALGGEATQVILKAILKRDPTILGFNPHDYEIYEQHRFYAGVFDLFLQSPKACPAFCVCVENKVQSGVDVEQLKKYKQYLDDLGKRTHAKTCLILNSKYGTEEENELTGNGIETSRWYTIAGALEAYCEQNQNDEIARYFLQFLRANGMEEPSSINRGDYEFPAKVGELTKSLKLILDDVKNSLESKFEVKKASWDFDDPDDPYFGIEIDKKKGQPYYLLANFGYIRNKSSLSFICQIYFVNEDGDFTHYVLDNRAAFEDKRKKAGKELGFPIELDDTYYFWTKMEVNPLSSIKDQSDQCKKFTINAIDAFTKYIIPELKNMEKEFNAKSKTRSK